MTWIILLAALIAFFFFGFRDKNRQGRKGFLNALIGLGFAVLGYLVLIALGDVIATLFLAGFLITFRHADWIGAAKRKLRERAVRRR